MKTPRDVHGADLADHLVRRWGFRRDRQAGSHIVLVSDDPAFSISIPAHKPLKLGLLASLLSDIAEKKSVTTQELLKML